MKTMSYLRNCSPTHTNGYKTPYGLFHGRKPALSHVHPFGWKVMLHIPSERCLKWDTKDWTGRFVGYLKFEGGYSVLDSKGAVVTVHDWSSSTTPLDRLTTRTYLTERMTAELSSHRESLVPMEWHTHQGNLSLLPAPRFVTERHSEITHSEPRPHCAVSAQRWKENRSRTQIVRQGAYIQA